MATKVLITGGAGFIGSHLVQEYLESGFEVLVVDLQAKPKLFDKLPINYYQQDITQVGLEDIIAKEKPELINHHASLINVSESFVKPVTYTTTNVLATIKLLELAKKYQAKQFIFASSAAVYGNATQFPIKETDKTSPESFYGLDKLLAEWYISIYSQFFTTTIFRYANVYGPRQTSNAEGGVVAIFCQKLAEGNRPTIFGNGDQTRDFVYVKDVALANIAASKLNKNLILHVSTGTQISVNELYKSISKIYNIDNKAIYQKARDGDIYDSVMSNERIKKVLSWVPKYSLNIGLTETAAYFKT